jgi:uncharacterized protein YqhQ
MRGRIILGLVVIAGASFAGDHRETMCVRQKDGTYKCKVTGKIEKEPCCDTPSNDRTPTPKPNK